MAQEQEIRSCEVCKKPTLHIVEATNHLLHWILIFVSAGLWFFIYFFIVFFWDKEFACTICGKKGSSIGLGTAILGIVVALIYGPDIVRVTVDSLGQGWAFFVGELERGWKFFISVIAPWIGFTFSLLTFLLLVTSFFVGLYTKPLDKTKRIERRKEKDLENLGFYSHTVGMTLLWLLFILLWLR